MTEVGKRSYTSTLRAEQARDTRRRIVRAAVDLFDQRGYGATTIDDVAAAAGVSRKTVFSSVGGKVALLKLGFDWAVGGDDEDVLVIDRPEIQRLRESTDPVFILEGFAAHMGPTMQRVAPVALAIEVAAAGDAEAAELLADIRRQRRVGMGMIAAQLDGLGALRDGVTVERATDLLTVYIDPAPFDRLVRLRGWTLDEYAAWLATCARATLLR